MSAETSTWLNSKILRGFAEKYGKAWWYRSDLDVHGSHFDGPVPLERAKELLGVRFLEGDLQATVINDDGVATYTDPTRKAIIHPTTHAFLGVFKQGYNIHPFDGWLLDDAQVIAGNGLQLASCGLLAGDAIAWAQWELPENIETPEGVSFRPFLTGATSVNGTLSTTYINGGKIVVCDNTLDGALADLDARVAKIRHSSKSLGRLDELQTKLGLMTSGDQAEAIAATIREHADTPVTDAQWSQFLDLHELTSLVDAKGDPKGARGITNAEQVRDELNQLWLHDERVAPWKGTAWGVLAADNTWRHWKQSVKGDTDRFERNMERSVRVDLHGRSQTGRADLAAMNTLARVLQPA